MQTAEELVAQRGQVYGDFYAGIACETAMMSIIDRHHFEVNGTKMHDTHRMMLSKIVMKLVRAAASPAYLDNWADIEGYAHLTKLHFIEQETHHAES